KDKRRLRASGNPSRSKCVPAGSFPRELSALFSRMRTSDSSWLRDPCSRGSNPSVRMAVMVECPCVDVPAPAGTSTLAKLPGPARNRNPMNFQIDVSSCNASAPQPAPNPGPSSEVVELLRQMLEVQREQLTYQRSAAAAHDMTARWRAFLSRWN